MTVFYEHMKRFEELFKGLLISFVNHALVTFYPIFILRFTFFPQVVRFFYGVSTSAGFPALRSDRGKRLTIKDIFIC